ncbi:MAG: dihydrodipicolinate synthase family protein [Ruminococcaceae bacterium]|nr:dihydrodipicolinate synthase family protein [Oscillospiraceae bacterium]
MAFKKPEGIFIPMVTSFNASDESVNVSGVKEVTNFLIENGIDGLIPSGSSGELVAMTNDEVKLVNRTVVETAAGRVKVFASTGAYRTKDVIDMSKDAEAAGADGVMIVTPWYMAPNMAEVYDHYKAIRAAINIPIMVYHNPYYSTCNMSMDFIAKLYNDGLIDAVKERQADVYNQQVLRYLTDDNFGLFYGYDVCPVETVSCWADGWVCGTGNLFPRENKTVFDLAKAQKMDEAMAYHFEKIRPYLPLFTENTAEGLPCPWLSVIKEGLKMRGVDAGVARKPVMGLPADMVEKVRNTLKAFGHI